MLTSKLAFPTIPSGSGLAAITLIIGTCISYFFYRKSKKEPSPALLFDSLRLLGSGEHLLPDEVQISFGDKSVRFLSRTIVTFWNDGTSLLDGSSIVPTDAPKISFADDSEILKISKIVETNSANGIFLQKCGDHPAVAHLGFEYLDPQDGASFEILHTDPAGNVECLGKIKGLPKGIRTINPNPRGVFPRNIRRRYPKPFFVAILAVGIVSLVTSALPHHPRLTTQHAVSVARVFLFVAGLMYVIGGSFALYMSRRRIPKTLLQK